MSSQDERLDTSYSQNDFPASLIFPIMWRVLGALLGLIVVTLGIISL
jgi:hypothetical protein